MSDEPVVKSRRDFDRIMSEIVIQIVKHTPEELEEKRKFADAHGMPYTVDYEDD